MAVRTAFETWFSEAISSRVSFWRAVSMRSASAMSGSTSPSGRCRKSCPVAARSSCSMLLMVGLLGGDSMRGSGQRAADSGQDRRSPARCSLSAARYHSPVRPKLAAALAIVAAALASVVFFFYFRDNFSTHYPVKVISAAVWRAGEIPWWNFYAGGGQPLAGNPNTLSFYPDNVLYLILPAHVAFNLHFILHLIAAWLAMRALTRSTWAAWLYVVSGIAIS